jgi:hypothetical protein
MFSIGLAVKFIGQLAKFIHPNILELERLLSDIILVTTKQKPLASSAVREAKRESQDTGALTALVDFVLLMFLNTDIRI